MADVEVEQQEIVPKAEVAEAEEEEPVAPVEKKSESSDEMAPASTIGDVMDSAVPEPAEAVEELVPVSSSAAEGESSPSECSSFQCSPVCSALMHPQVQYLIHWRNPVHSAVTLCVGMCLLVLLRSATVLSVISLWLLCMLLVAVTFRVTIATILTFQKKDLKNPLERYMDGGLPFEQDMLVAALTKFTTVVLGLLEHVRSCLLVEDVRSSVLFFLHMLTIYQLTSMMSPLTIKTMALLLLFAIPPFYEKNKAQVDPVLKDVGAKVKGLVAQLRGLPVIGQLMPKEKTA